MKYFILLIATFFLVLSCSTAPAPKKIIADSDCYLEAPLPHYDVDKGYGWLTDVKCTPDGPEYINEIIKVWQFGETREIFVDEGRDETCNKVLIFTKIDERDMWSLRGAHECKYVDDQIKKFLQVKEGRQEI